MNKNKKHKNRLYCSALVGVVCIQGQLQLDREISSLDEIPTNRNAVIQQNAATTTSTDINTSLTITPAEISSTVLSTGNQSFVVYGVTNDGVETEALDPNYNLSQDNSGVVNTVFERVTTTANETAPTISITNVSIGNSSVFRADAAHATDSSVNLLQINKNNTASGENITLNATWSFPDRIDDYDLNIDAIGNYSVDSSRSDSHTARQRQVHEGSVTANINASTNHTNRTRLARVYGNYSSIVSTKPSE